jgi:ABC-type multidrug transport system fused ATPase/permease subunit
MNVLVAVVAVILVVLATQLGSDAGNVGAGLVTLITLGNTLTTIVIAYTGLETSLGAISRLKTFSDETELEAHGNDDVIPEEAWPVRGHLQMNGVEASYDEPSRVLKGLSLTIAAGQKVAICGRTGRYTLLSPSILTMPLAHLHDFISGKSSILALLVRLIEPIASKQPDSTASTPPILIDGMNLNNINSTVLRERIISVSQDSVFLPDSTTFRLNLDPWEVASETEMLEVLSDLGLLAVVEAKGGLDTPIRGAELSAGQKQLFSLARAVLRRRVKKRTTDVDGGLLLLDEITSSADTETERRVRRLLDVEFKDYTVVMVTHRLEMAMACDRVIVLDTGVVVEDGRPADLLDIETGWFKDLWTSIPYQAGETLQQQTYTQDQ